MERALPSNAYIAIIFLRQCLEPIPIYNFGRRVLCWARHGTGTAPARELAVRRPFRVAIKGGS
jgi:hypothetical protein